MKLNEIIVPTNELDPMCESLVLNAILSQKNQAKLEQLFQKVKKYFGKGDNFEDAIRLYAKFKEEGKDNALNRAAQTYGLGSKEKIQILKKAINQIGAELEPA